MGNEEVQSVEEIEKKDEDAILSPEEFEETNDKDECSNEYDEFFEDVWGEIEQTYEEKELEQIRVHTESQEEVEASESFCDKVSYACEKSNEENKCSKEDNSIFEEFWGEIEQTNEKEEWEQILQKEVEVEEISNACEEFRFEDSEAMWKKKCSKRR